MKWIEAANGELIRADAISAISFSHGSIWAYIDSMKFQVLRGATQADAHHLMEMVSDCEGYFFYNRERLEIEMKARRIQDDRNRSTNRPT